MSDRHPYVVLARRQIEAWAASHVRLDGAEAHRVDPDESLWSLRRACFVSIKNPDGSLRGCIGTILPAAENLAEEILANAVSASARDPRFPPVRAEELPGLRVSVDVLSEPEPVSSLEELDPKRFGVIVSKGFARGVLLPDLEGVDSVEQQLSIACSKAGLRSFDGVRVERFTVERFRESKE